MLSVQPAQTGLYLTPNRYLNIYGRGPAENWDRLFVVYQSEEV